MYTRKGSGTNEIHYLTRDHLGSVDSVTSAAGAVEVRMAFGAFGQRRRESGWSGALSSADWTGVASTTRRGYTFHETLDNLNLTHMNGRVYDQASGSFLSPDPFVQAPGFTQSFNRYAYVFNNPLSYTDPSGYNADDADGAADSAAAVASGNPILFLVQLARLWGGSGETVSEQMDRKYREELGKLVPQFDPVQRPRTANTDAGEPVKDDPAAGFSGARSSAVSWTCPGACHTSGIPIPEVTPEVRAATTRFYQNLGEDFIPGLGLHRAATGEYLFSGDEASRVGGVLASAPFVGFALKRGAIIPKVANPKLANLVNDLYKGARGPNTIGTGSTADAIRNELATGLPTHGVFHSDKGRQYINALNNWLRKNPNADYYDRVVAESLRMDLEAALQGL